jgi:hypothetical protein
MNTFSLTNNSENEMTNPNRVSATDIAAKWSKVTHPEAVAIKSVDGLSAQVQRSYGFDKATADAEVKQFMGDRTF